MRWLVGRASKFSRLALAANGNDLNAAVVALAVTLGDHAFELCQRQVYHPSIPRVHRLEGDDLALIDGLFAESPGHRRQRVVTPRAVAFGVHEHVTAVEAGPIDHSMGQKLDRLKHCTLLPDDASRVATDDLDVHFVDFVGVL